jgi:hypothetical protein
MNPWLAWVTFALVIVVLSLAGCHFSLRTLRVVTAFTAAASAVFITWYGLTHAAKAPGSLWFAVSSPECEMEHPSEWIANDPDFGGLHSSDERFSAAFRDFLATLKARDYPSAPRLQPGLKDAQPPE